jgi:hypothetical protein
MAPKHPYTQEAEKGVFLHALDKGLTIINAAKEAHIKIKTARGIKRRADKITYSNDENQLPTSLHDRTVLAPKTGRRHALSELNKEQLDNAINQDRHHREMLQYEVAQEIEEPFPHTSKSTIRREARALGIHRVKPTKKLSLTPIQEAIRYELALSRKDWTIDDWKRVTFSDEASILVGEHRGRHLISRKVDERYNKDCIEVRYNSYSEAMFWGCFSYDFKGPCHVYLKETAAQTQHYQKIIDDHNALQLPIILMQWRAKEALKLLKWSDFKRKPPGKPAVFENFRKHHYLTMLREKGKGGIDHIRYRHEVIEPLVIPYMREVSLQRPHDPDNLDIPGPIFQQDNAPSHKSHWTLELLAKEGIELLEHPGDSPDMNAIEKEWMPLRIAITNVWNRPHTLEWTARAWRSEWEAMPQDRIRGWIWEMLENNQRILDDEGGNRFHG